jgi:FixJ family two-component response regulator
MEGGKYRILFIEDDEVVQMAFKRLMRENEVLCTHRIVGSISEAQRALLEHAYDAVVTDYRLQDGTAFDLMGSTRGVPVIFVTGFGDEEVAVKALKSGAYDYLIKDPDHNYLKMIMLTVVRAVSRKRAEDHLQLLSHTLKTIHECVCISARNGQILFANEAFYATYGYSVDEGPSLPRGVLWSEGSQVPAWGRPLKDGDYVHRRKDGSLFPVWYSSSMVDEGNGGEPALVEVTRDITQNKKLQEQVKELSGFLPICASCKKVRNDQGYWDEVEEYMSHRSDVRFTHGFCPTCVHNYSPDKPQPTR